MADVTLVQNEVVTVAMEMADRNGPIPDGTFSSGVYRILSGGTIIGSCSVTIAAGGIVYVPFAATETDVPGVFEGNLRMVRGDGSVLFFPSERNHTVTIRATPAPPS